MSDASPQLVADRYRLISPLGQGGMGRVWKARDEVLHRDVAIKELVPPPGLTTDERREMRERSLREARAIARLNNINVVRIFDVLRTDGDPWIVMEYVASRSLQDTLAEDGPVPAAQAVQIGLGVLNALKAAHKAGIMHRDVKPGNVLLGTDGRVVLTDFGLATIPGDPNVTRTGMVLGSPAYIAPERARDGTAGPEADLWSLGATLYAAVEGKSPFARPSAISTLAALATEPVPPARNAGPLKQVLAGLLRKNPEERITAESAERMLRRASGRRSRGISLLDGVRRPGPNGPREPRQPLVPAPRPSGEQPTPPVAPPVPRTPPAVGPLAAGAAAAGAASSGPSGSGPDPATGKPPVSDAAPTAKVAAPTGADADPTTKVDAGPDADPTTKVDAASTAAGAAGAESASSTDAASSVSDTGPAAGSDASATDTATSRDDDSADQADEGTTTAGTPTTPDGSDATVLSATTSGSATASADDTKVDGPAVEATAKADASAGGTPDRSDSGEPTRRVDPPAPAKDATRVAPASTSLMPSAPVSPAAPARGSVFKTGQLRSERTRRAVLVGALVALLLVGLVVAVPLLTSGDGEDGSTPQDTAGTSESSAPPTSAPAVPPPTSAAPPSASPSPTPSESAAGSLPEGWTMRNDPVGFKVAVPDGWRRSAGGTWVKYRDPDGVSELTIDRTDRPQRDAAAAWRAIEPGRKNVRGVQGYRRIDISTIDCKWRTCADWDWYQTRNGVELRVRNRGFVTASNRGFALRWEVPNSEWNAQLPNFETLFREFVPDRED
ncbi:serine/threonine-protein kinase [Micromonospora craniellae]|uniref:non-specific serine/threonine protein kinase n=1 Tax=Micromonospora craniellae TaxID=2294034 RepID=A0A372FTU4_9ACTN|nr:serine/threonine-protein kinase [Micromonospora craniellae]QOC93675.1 protein kinase [Micromonospora craniellae]RFS43996.1 serine/threonine protein kinase [Micromonospora craniellae]